MGVLIVKGVNPLNFTALVILLFSLSVQDCFGSARSRLIIEFTARTSLESRFVEDVDCFYKNWAVSPRETACCYECTRMNRSLLGKKSNNVCQACKVESPAKWRRYNDLKKSIENVLVEFLHDPSNLNCYKELRQLVNNNLELHESCEFVGVMNCEDVYQSYKAYSEVLQHALSIKSLIDKDNKDKFERFMNKVKID